MGTTALLILGLSGVFAGWIVLTILGNERQQQVQDAESIRRATQSAAAHAAAVAAEAAKKSQLIATSQAGAAQTTAK